MDFLFVPRVTLLISGTHSKYFTELRIKTKIKKLKIKITISRMIEGVRHIPSRSAVFADSQDVCVCVCVLGWGRGQAYTQECSCVGLYPG